MQRVQEKTNSLRVKISIFALYTLSRRLLSSMSNKSLLSRMSWIILAVLLLAVVAVAVRSCTPEEELPPPPPPVEPQEPEIVTPEVDSLEDFEEYVEGRPLPEAQFDRKVGSLILEEHLRGNENARLTLYQYTNLNNPYTALMHPGLIDLVQRDDRVNWAFRHYTSFDVKNSYPAAYVSECVYLQLGHSGFWNYVDRYMEEVDSLKSEDDFYALGERVGANREQLETCRTNNESEQLVKDHVRLGFVLSKVEVTPSFFLKDNITKEIYAIDGAATLEYIVDTVNKAWGKYN